MMENRHMLHPCIALSIGGHQEEHWIYYGEGIRASGRGIQVSAKGIQVVFARGIQVVFEGIRVSGRVFRDSAM